MAPNAREIFHNFSNETTLHGFKRLWIGSPWRWPFWTFIILVGLSMSIYQIKSKAQVLRDNPLNININLVYFDVLKFPAVTVCSTLKIRVSFIVNSTYLMNSLQILYPQEDSVVENITEKEEMLLRAMGKTTTTREFFKMASIPVDQLILWCRLPTGQECSSDDFEAVLTDEGFCYRYKHEIFIKEAGPSNSFKLLLNLAQYERTPDIPPSGVRLVINEPIKTQVPIPASGYDVMPGYQTSVVLRKAKTTQLGNCEEGNPLTYYEPYTYAACRVEAALVNAMSVCGCRPYTLPAPISTEKTNETVQGLPECNLVQHFTCVEKTMQDSVVVTNESYVSQASNVESACIGECVRLEYEKEVYYNVFKDTLAFKKMTRPKTELIKAAYGAGKDGIAYLNIFRHRDQDQDYSSIKEASNGFRDLIVKRKLVPPYGTVAEILLDRLECMKTIYNDLGINNTALKRSLELLNNTAPGVIVKLIKELEPKIESLEIEKTLKLANELKRIHSGSCDNPDICSLGALYDMLKVRAQVEEKNSEIKTLIENYVNKLNDAVQTFIGDKRIMDQLFKNMNENDREDLRQLLEYYVNQLQFCLLETGRTYQKILDSGQPSMKTSTAYNNFLDALNYANLTIYGTCKKGGLVTDSLFNATSRRELGKRIEYWIQMGETDVQRSIKANTFTLILLDFVEQLDAKMNAHAYDSRTLNESIFYIDQMDRLLNRYLNQTSFGDSLVKKSSLYFMIHESVLNFDDGLSNYKSVVNAHVLGLLSFFQTYIDNLTEAYPGPDEDLNYLQTIFAADAIEENSNISQTTRTVPLEIEQILCLKKSKNFLARNVSDQLSASLLDTYKETVNALASNLGLYVEDIRVLKTFYDENLGLVNIYFRDMGVKETNQERAYDFLSFLCDIGGVVGLWLGGSMLSFFEIFDLLLFENVRTICSWRKRLRSPATVLHSKDKYDLPVLATDDMRIAVSPNAPSPPMNGSLPTKVDNNNGEAADGYKPKPPAWRLYYDKS